MRNISSLTKSLENTYILVWKMIYYTRYSLLQDTSSRCWLFHATWTCALCPRLTGRNRWIIWILFLSGYRLLLSEAQLNFMDSLLKFILCLGKAIYNSDELWSIWLFYITIFHLFKREFCWQFKPLREKILSCTGHVSC